MFDFTAAVNAAKEVVERQENREGSQGKNSYTLVYPQPGQTIVVRPLFNPKSGKIVRLVNRHEKVPCYRTYGVECPICKVMQQVKDMTGTDPFGRQKASKGRGICLAQYISSTNPIDKGNNQGNVQPGEIILFMFPWSVYQQINVMIQAIAQSPTGMDQAFCHAQTGFFIQVSVTGDYKYTTTNVPYMTFQSNLTDESFMSLLDKLESIDEMVIPSSITAEVSKQVKEYEDSIYKQYIAPRVPNLGPQQVPQSLSNTIPTIPVPQGQTPGYQGGTPYAIPTTTVPQNINVVPTTGQPVQTPYSTASTPINPPVQTPYTFGTSSADQIAELSKEVDDDLPFDLTPPVAPPTVTNNVPACYGKHQDNSPQCIICPVEMQCSQSSGK